jgi:WD40 repeat protein
MLCIILNSESIYIQHYHLDKAPFSTLVSDTRNFLRSFPEPTTSSSAHIYSTIAFAPRTSKIYKRYHDTGGYSSHIVTTSLAVWPGYVTALRDGVLPSLAFSSHGHYCTVAMGNEIQVWDTISNKCISGIKGFSSLGDTLLSNDGKYLAVCGHDGKPQIRDTMDCERILSEVRGWDPTFSPNGRYILTHIGQKLQPWDVVSGSPIGNRVNVMILITALAISDTMAIAAGSHDGTIILIDGATGNVRELHYSSVTVTSLSFSYNGTTLLSRTSNSTVRVWDAVTGSPMAVGSQLMGVSADVSRFSLDGKRIFGPGSEIDILTGTVGPRCIRDDDIIGGALRMDAAGWLRYKTDGKLVCWVPVERQGNWESKQGKVIMSSLWPPGIETVIDVQAFDG